MPRVSVVLPTIEEESVFQIIKDLRSEFGRSLEIIVVDKSSDAYFKRLKETGVAVLRQKDRGVENAIMMGLRYAHGDILASIDADGTHELRGLIEAVKLVERGKYDFVLGNRFGNLQPGAMSAYIHLGNSALSSIFSALYHTRIHDVLTGLFVLTRKSFDSIRDIDPYRAGIAFFAIEMARGGYRLGEVDIKYYKRAYGKSKLTKSKLVYGVNVASHLIRQIRDYSPLMLFGGFGTILILVGLGLGLTVFLQFLNSGVFVTTGRALIAFMLVVVGFLFFVAGLILDVLLEIERKLNSKQQK